MKNLLLLCLILLTPYYSFSQQEGLVINFSSIDNLEDGSTVIKAIVSGGSGSYQYLWNSNKGDFKTSRTDPYISVPSVREKLEYTLFVRDLSSKKIISKTINLNEDGININVYPNPSKEQITVNIGSLDDSLLPGQILLFNENSSIPVKSFSVKDELSAGIHPDGQIVIDVRELPRGIYYLHVNPKRNSNQLTKKVRIKLE